MRNSDLIIVYTVVTFAVLFPFFLSENEKSAQLQTLQTQWQSHQDSISNLFFIPSKENLKSEVIFSNQILEQLTPFGSTNNKADSLKSQINSRVNHLKSWTSDLELYDLQRHLPKGKIKESLSMIPDFLRSGTEVLIPEELSNCSSHIERNEQFYWHLKKLFPERETHEARMALKEFIAFLTSVKYNQFILREKDLNSKSLVNHQ